MGIEGVSIPVKRTIAKNGQAYYYAGKQRLNTKTGASKYVEQNFPSLSPESLTKQELRSFRSKEAGLRNSELFREQLQSRFRFKGRMIPKYLQLVLNEAVLQLVGTDEKELTKVFPDVKSYGELLKKAQSILSPVVLNPTEYGLPNLKRNRVEVENVIDIARRIDEEEVYRLLTLQVKTKSGELIVGRIAGLQAIRDYEILEIDELMKQGGNPAYVKFRHTGEIDVENKTLTIDLNLTKIDPQFSP